MALLSTYLSFLCFLCFYLTDLSFSCSNSALVSCGNYSTDIHAPPCPKPFNLSCNSSTNQIMIQINGSSPLFHLQELSLPEHRIVLHELESSSPFNNQNCSFFYNFTEPRLDFNLSGHHDVLMYEQRFFDCSKLESNFDHEFFLELNRTVPCKNYNFYYTNRRLDNQTLEALPPNCSTNWEPSYEWNFSFDEDGVLSLLSAGFSNHLELKHECFDCGIIGSGCSVNGGLRTVCQEKFQKEKKTKLIVTGVSAGFAATFLVSCCLFLSYKRCRRNQRSSTILLGRTYSSESSFFKGEDAECQTSIFSYRELREATDNFNEYKELGDGGFGTVYKGELRDGRIVAVKRLYENNCKRLEQFMNEVAILSGLRHQNLVTLYGCTSRHSRELLLVYEYIPNGTVADHLHGHRAHEASLSWQVRLSIAVETASALAYLHAVEPPIIHRDVKTNNILLDNNFNVKVADFGLSRLFPVDATHISTAPQGTPGYLDPEYHQCYRLTQKSDVYSFGVVLVELISSKPAVDVTRRHHEINLASMAINKIQNNELDELVDEKLFSESEEVRRMIKVVAELAFRCLQGERDLRPPIKEVLEVLRGVQSSEEGCSVSGAPPVSPDSVMDHVCVSESTTSRTSL